eukprot:8412900-Ditylum_brightwellii.AAC.1
MSSYFMPYCNGNSSSTTPCLNEELSRNNISSEQLEAIKCVVDEHVVRLEDVDNALSLSFSNDCNMHDSRDMSVNIADFNIAESSTSYLPLNSAEATSMNESVM